jgi:protocatechuate 3,4-dioxygenase beta subunit
MEMVRAACFALSAAIALGQAASQPGRIEGRVENIAGDPVSKATVTLTHTRATAGSGNLFPISQSTAVETSSDGKFSFADLAPGQYTLRVERSGFASLSRFRTFSLEPGQARTDFRFNLTPQAVIMGRVIDSDGDPLQNAGVSALRENYNRNGRQWLTAGSARTDSLGNFRISALLPGRYFLTAGARKYGVQTFYPGFLSISGASAITATAGSELSGIDIRVLRDGPTGFAIRGKAFMTSGGRVAHNQTLTIKTRDGQGGGGPAGVVRDDGSFEIKNVEPGQYFIQTLDATARSAGVVTEWSDKGQVEVAVADRDVENVLLSIRPAMSIAGTITLDGGTGPAPRLTVVLMAHDVPFNGANPSGQVREDGSFEIARLGPVLYDVQTRDLPESAYAKSISFAGRDVTHAPLDLTGETAGKLEIVLSPHAASVSGTVKPDSAIALWDKDGVRTATADEHGAFRFGNLPPGDYRILAWEGVDNGLPEYAPFRARFESQATQLTLTEDARVAPQINIVSRETSQTELRRIP